jgi:hypothetical protein
VKSKREKTHYILKKYSGFIIAKIDAILSFAPLK